MGWEPMKKRCACQKQTWQDALISSGVSSSAGAVMQSSCRFWLSRSGMVWKEKRGDRRAGNPAAAAGEELPNEREEKMYEKVEERERISKSPGWMRSFQKEAPLPEPVRPGSPRAEILRQKKREKGRNAG